MKRDTAKVFRTGRSQTVRIPKGYRFSCDEVLIEREGERLILTPCPRSAKFLESSWKDYFARAPRLPADFPEVIEDEPAAPENR
jgi:antitoxin VapB